VHPSQTCLQRILWRDNLSANVDNTNNSLCKWLPSLTVQLPRHFWPGAFGWAARWSIHSRFSMRSTGFLWHIHRSGYSRRIKTSRWNHSAVKIRSIRVKQMGLELLWTIGNRQSWSCQSLSEIMLRTHVFWACSGMSVRIHSNFSANLIQKPMLYQNGSYFPRSLNCSILWAFWVRSLWSQNLSCKICGNSMGRVRSSGHPHSLDRF